MLSVGVMSREKESELTSINLDQKAPEYDQDWIESEDDEEENEEEERERLLKKSRVVKEPTEEDLILSSTFLDDVIAGINDAKFIAPVIGLCVLVFGVLYASDFFRPSPGRPPRMTHDEFKAVRPVLDAEKMADIYRSTFYAETQFVLPEPHYDRVSLKFSTKTDRNGHKAPADIFYSGVIYGVSAFNPHGIEFSDMSRRRRLQSKLFDDSFEDSYLQELKNDFESIIPTPTAIFDRLSQNNETSFSDRGIAVFFSLEDLERQGMLSSDPHEPWKRTLEPVLKAAREHRQIYVTQWYPRKFGRQDVASVANDPHRHETVVRQIIPTRTGLNNIKSTAAVWQIWTNYTPHVVAERAIKKPWTEDDHWTHYPLENN